MELRSPRQGLECVADGMAADGMLLRARIQLEFTFSVKCVLFSNVYEVDCGVRFLRRLSCAALRLGVGLGL